MIFLYFWGKVEGWDCPVRTGKSRNVWILLSVFFGVLVSFISRSEFSIFFLFLDSAAFVFAALVARGQARTRQHTRSPIELKPYSTWSTQGEKLNDGPPYYTEPGPILRFTHTPLYRTDPFSFYQFCNGKTEVHYEFLKQAPKIKSILNQLLKDKISHIQVNDTIILLFSIRFYNLIFFHRN